MGSEKLSGGSPVLRTWHSYDNDNRLSSQGWQIGSDTYAQTYSYSTWDGSLSAIVLSDNDAATSDLTVSYTYDDLRRLSSVSNGVFTSTYSYHDDAENGKASPRLKSIVHEGVNYSGKTVECNYTYTYDVNGNIVSAAFGSRVNTYVYDANNQLIRENNDRRQYTQTWEYDAFGNILSTSKYAYTTGELGEPTETIEYKYEDENGWGDLLTEYNGQTIEYDEIGNPRYVRDAEENVVKSYTWTQGRQLATHMTKGVTWTYSYDAGGLRTKRTNGTTTYEYIYAGDKLVRLIKNGEVVDFGYAGGQLATMTYDGVTYYYVLNGQGDVIGLTDSTGKMVIGYVYSAYGIPTPLKADETLTPILKLLNPFMYRGYVYDIESGLYYLQSRYYDPELGRFINADALVSTGQGVLGNNMFAYCLNNPIKFSDHDGFYSRYREALFGEDNLDSNTNEFYEAYLIAVSIGQNATMSKGVISIDMVNAYEDIRAISEYISLSYICDIIAMSACDTYANTFGEEFLLSDYCVSYEILEHIRSYYYAVGDRMLPNKLAAGFIVSKIFKKKDYDATDIYNATMSIDIRESDVIAGAGITSQAFAFDYQNGIRDIYIGTDRDPWADSR